MKLRINTKSDPQMPISSSGVSPKECPNARAVIGTILTCVVAMTVASGCATNKTQTQPLVSGKLPRPNQILVYDFVATPGEVPPDSIIAREFSLDTTTQTAEQIATGRDLGSFIAARLTGDLRALGLPARQVARGATPPPTEPNDILLRGYLVSVKEGSTAKRLTIGFGSGASELQAAMEGFQVTGQGLRLLETGTGTYGGSGSPGMGAGAVGLAATGNPAGLIVTSAMGVYREATGSSKIQARAQTAADEISKVLEKRAREVGWIK